MVTINLEWVTANKLSELTGLSRSMIVKLVDNGDVKFSKSSKAKNSSLMISVSSFNKFWDKRKI